MSGNRTPVDYLLDRVAWESMPDPAIDNDDGIPYATHRGVLHIGDYALKCYVLNDGSRIFDEEDILRMFGFDSAPPQDANP